MTRSWQIRPYQRGDEKQILELRRVVFGDLDPVRLKKSTWQWQFQNNPAGRATCLLAESKGRIVGQYVTIPTRFSIRGKETRTAFSCDTMIHPRYRRQGMFSALARELYDFLKTRWEIDMVWGFPNEQSRPGFSGKLGWRMLSHIPLMVLPIRPIKMICHLISKKTKKEFAISNKAHVYDNVKTRLPNLLMLPIARFDDAFETLWLKHSTMAPVIQIRDHHYLQWRYLSVPEFGYRPFAVFHDERLLGYWVLRMMVLKSQVFGVLVDIFPFPMESGAVTLEIFSFARQCVNAHGGDFLTCLLPPQHGGILKKAGFKKVPEIINPKTWWLGYRCAKNTLLGDLNDWHVTYGDTDVV